MNIKPRSSCEIKSPPSLLFCQKTFKTKDQAKKPQHDYQGKQKNLQYFQKLQGQLLSKSNRYTSLISKNTNLKLANGRKMTHNTTLNQYSVEKSQNENQTSCNILNLTSLESMSKKKYKLSHQNDYQIDEYPKKKISSNVSLQDLHKQIKDSYSTYLNRYNDNGKKRVQFKTQSFLNTPRQQEKVKNNFQQSCSKSKKSIKMQKAKNIIQTYKKNKQIKEGQSGLQMHRKLVYNLTFQEKDPSVLEDSPDKFKSVKLNDQKRLLQEFIKQDNAKSKNSSASKQIISLCNLQKRQACLKPRKNSKFGQNLGETVSTKFSYNAKFSDRYHIKNQNNNSSEHTDILQKNPNHKSKSKLSVNQRKKKLKSNQNLEQIKNKSLSNSRKKFKNHHLILNQKTQIQRSFKRNNNLCIDDFLVMGQIGQGKVGTVFVAKHFQSNFLCALKVIQKNIVDQHMMKQLTRQIKIQMFLDHPNVVQLYAFFSDDENIYLVLQLCFSGNLYTHLRKQTMLPEHQTRIIIKQVCYAVEYMHDNDILHRDLKPENILFHQNIIKICDFGWSVHSPLLRNTLCGTPIYSSPEIVQKKEYSNKIDVWNIGILTYELLCGRVPFQIRSQSDLYRVVIEQIHFPKMIQLSKECRNFIQKCLDKNPDQRFNIGQLLQHPFLENTQ